jgi:2-polyprenyl-6-methoxyphenol hydroxylase-like FAD-dependent oxidoreductase
MRIACVGGGPAGLFFSILASQLDGGHRVTVHERYPAGTTYGWGVVFWSDLLAQLDEHDPPTAEAVRAHAFEWQDQVVDVTGRAPVRIPGHGYSMARQTLLALLAERATDLGVEIRYEDDVRDPADLGDVDLVVAADGVNSALRTGRRDGFGTTVARGSNRYMWLGTTRVFDSFTFPVVRTDAGWIWAHAYGFNGDTSTFVVETTAETWHGLGFDRMGTDPTLRRLEEIFAGPLGGHPLRPQAGTRDIPPWLQFQRITNQRWHAGPVVLMGDAAHTTHFTIGSGTRLALEDAMALATALTDREDLDRALDGYGRRRRAALRTTLRSAANSARWFEQLPRHVDHDRFADLLLRRRSAAQAYLPPEVFLRLSDVALSVPGLTEPVRRAVARVLSLPA